MNTIVKLIIGLLITLSGIAWYVFHSSFEMAGLMDSLFSLKVLLSGSIGMVLILTGLLIMWVELEELKDEKLEKKTEGNKKTKKK
ncbi:MAG: hypothetical protein DRP06_00645 [Candidatus Aenigmatarchaeota archaeon]|nr:MAG: hypothetical protein DRP06_00645 [Candidatus Aenigmarchaeota archaeon]